MGIPYDITFHPKWWHKNAGVSFDKEFFFDNDYRIEADIRMRRILYEKFGEFGVGEKDPKPRPILGSDLIASGFLYSEILGCEVRYSKDNPPEVICASLSDEEVENLEYVDLKKDPLWQKVEKSIEGLLVKFGFVDACINLMGIQNIALDLRGQELYIDYYTNPELARKLLDVCTHLAIDIGKRLYEVSDTISAGVTGIVRKAVPDIYLTSNCSVDMVSLETYKEFLLPCDKALAKSFPEFGIHHCGKSMEHVVEGYREVPELKFAEVGAFSDIKRVREVLPDVFLNLRYSPVRLKNATFEELKYDIEKMVRDGYVKGLVSVSCVGIDDDVPDEKVRKFLQVVSGISI